MSNITFLISAGLTVLLLQGVEYTRITPTTIQMQTQIPGMALESVGSKPLNIGRVENREESQLDQLKLSTKAILTKS